MSMRGKQTPTSTAAHRKVTSSRLQSVLLHQAAASNTKKNTRSNALHNDHAELSPTDRVHAQVTFVQPKPPNPITGCAVLTTHDGLGCSKLRPHTPSKQASCMQVWKTTQDVDNTTAKAQTHKGTCDDWRCVPPHSLATEWQGVQLTGKTATGWHGLSRHK
jgi:hypothetical protein